jgi:hypothetical protein
MKVTTAVVTLVVACAVCPITGSAQDVPAGNPAQPATPAPADVAQTVRTALALRTQAFGLPLPVRRLAVMPTLGLPFSADGITTTTQVLADGTRLEQQTNTRLFRDSAGRVRREQAIVGLMQAALPVVTITDPAAAVSYTLDARTRTAYRAPLQAYVRTSGMPMPGDRTTGSASYRNGRVVSRTTPTPRARAEGPNDAVGVIPSGTGSRIETLSTLQIAGLWSSGTRTSVTLARGMVGNNRPFDVTTERWTSTDLNVVTLSRSDDPRVGTTEYRLTSVVRAEPPADLFVIPAEYRVVDTVPDPADAGR